MSVVTSRIHGTYYKYFYTEGTRHRRLDFADAYMEVLGEINQLLDWSKENLPRLIGDLMLAV